MQQYYWYNGQLIHSSHIQISIDNPGLLFGATVFTTLRIYENNLDHHLTNWFAHQQRIKKSLNFFGWSQPDWERLRQGAESLKCHFPILRLTIFPDGCELITGRFLPANLAKMQTNGITAKIADRGLYRSLPTHKTGNYLAPWLAKTDAQTASQPAVEAIFVDQQGNWLETTTGNLWGWGDGCWWTPPVTAGILPGIARSHLLKYLQTQNQTQNEIIREEPWNSDIINNLETLAYSNCVIEIIPIHTVIYPTQQLQYNPHHASLDSLRRFFTTSGLGI